jgi:hypothetical protein
MKSFKQYLIENIIDDGGDGPSAMPAGRNRVPPGSITPPQMPHPTPMYTVPTVTQDGKGYPTIPDNFEKPTNNNGMPDIDYEDLDRLFRELQQYLLWYDSQHYTEDYLREKLIAWLQGISGIDVGQLRGLQMQQLLAKANSEILTRYPHITDQQRNTIQQLLKDWYYRWTKELKNMHPGIEIFRY